MKDNPLVSLCLTSYNQIDTIRGALGSALAQTYSPLEIVISDDASTDGTIEVIEQIIEDYRRNGGGHSVFFLKQPEDLNIIRNYEACFRAAHGELLITGSGDDVSMPDRAEKIVSAWLAADRKPTVIHHAWFTIDRKGRCIGRGGPRDSDWPLGACSAYRRDVFERFPTVVETNAYEDMVFCARACMLGETLIIPDRLLCYRFGGETGSNFNHHSMILKGSRRELDSLRQMAIDVAYAKGRFDSTRVSETERRNLQRKKRAEDRLAFLETRGMTKKWRIGRKNGLIKWSKGALFTYGVYVLPMKVANPISNFYFAWKQFRSLLTNHFRYPPREVQAVQHFCRKSKERDHYARVQGQGVS